jgi:hypothetical protein
MGFCWVQTPGHSTLMTANDQEGVTTDDRLARLVELEELTPAPREPAVKQRTRTPSVNSDNVKVVTRTAN